MEKAPGISAKNSVVIVGKIFYIASRIAANLT